MTAQETPIHNEKSTLTTSVTAPSGGGEKTASKGQLLLEWSSPARFFTKRSREYYTTVGAIVFLLSIILFFFEEWLAIVVMLAVAFVAYVFSKVPPENIKHRITMFGIETMGYRYTWLELYEFWFEEKIGETMLTIQTRLPFPSRLHILLGSETREKVKDVLQEYLPYKAEPVHTFVDRAADWLSNKFPLETVAS